MVTIIIHRVCATFLSVTGFALNLLTVVAIVRSQLHRQTAIAFVLNFVIINLLVCAVCLPIIMVTSFATTFVTSRMTGCKIGGFIIYSTIGGELMALLLIAFNRYFLIVHFPLYPKIYNSNRNVVIMLIVSWIIYPIIFIFPLTETWGEFTYDIHRFACHPLNSTDGLGNFIIWFVLVTMLPTLAYCYFAIIYKVISNRRRVNANRTNSKEISCNKNEMQLVLTVILILTTFAILYIPFLVLGLLDPHMKKYGVVIHVVSIYFGWSHVIVNPLIYSVMNKQIQQSYETLLRCGKSRREIIRGTQGNDRQTANGMRSSDERNTNVKEQGSSEV